MTVLLVEDDLLVRECLGLDLRDAGFQVIEAGDGVEALSQMGGSLTPSVLVTDLRLGSGMNGLRLIAEARRRWPRLRAVLISGAELEPSCLIGIDPLLLKPFSGTDLVRAVMDLASGDAATEADLGFPTPSRPEFVSKAGAAHG